MSSEERIKSGIDTFKEQFSIEHLDFENPCTIPVGHEPGPVPRAAFWVRSKDPVPCGHSPHVREHFVCQAHWDKFTHPRMWMVHPQGGCPPYKWLDALAEWRRL